ncbi:Sodium/hydrogen exchanger family-domain-containing protein [Elsinoe ampelina]|uniref:Sodium/hydrogen exchanger family-domain-containing protein n=1 Tax=Elsinoe ampelina TaxID=302913 RepID=A0A6A6GQ08_9PEZI|nr:Sodium/hydrogen exchanger family-domain-containing protein [Elsinoe ampelina]
MATCPIQYIRPASMEATATSPDATSLTYIEPATVLLLIVTSLILFLNVLNSILDRFIYCGLIGQIFLGILYGQPGAKWLDLDLQVSIQTLGYLGLVLIVYEGGLSTSIATLKSNLYLSVLVAVTGIAAPMGLSFSLMAMLPIGPLQAFAAGAALCATSLGTTFTVLSTSGLSETKLGVILSSAAIIDDVVGLVMIQVIENLSSSSDGGFSASTIIRPVFVSLAVAVVVPAICRWVIVPGRRLLNLWSAGTGMESILKLRETAFAMHTLLLIGLSVGAYYAGTSILFAAYLAGAVVSWWDSLPVVATTEMNAVRASPSDSGLQSQDASSLPQPSTEYGHEEALQNTGMAVYHHYHHPAIQRILRPFFFASIGFSIPITQLFTGSIVWRGLVYSVLMTIGKLVCGLWLVRFNSSLGVTAVVQRLVPNPSKKAKDAKSSGGSKREGKATTVPAALAEGGSTEGTAQSATAATAPPEQTSEIVPPNISRKRQPAIPKPLSLYPSYILGCAMVARGEIGFLISSLAESQGVFAGGEQPASGSSDLFLVVTWAILLCTILGPLVVGLLVRRVKKLQSEERERERSRGSGREDPLGVWGLIRV